MTRRNRRIWLAVAMVALIAIAVGAHFLGGGMADLGRQIHGPR